jgi:hypothetical protein
MKSVEPSLFSILQWFTGVWIGVSEGTYIEEHWSTLREGGLMGMFRMLRGGKPAFYELMTLAIEGEEIILRIKHFNPGLKGWETQDESVVFVLVRVDPGQAIFYQRNIPEQKWMVYQKDGSDLSVYFETEDGEAPGNWLKFMRA